MARKPAKKAPARKAPGRKTPKPKQPAKPRTTKRAKSEEPAIDPAFENEESQETRGRPPKYRKEFANIAKRLCVRGATDAELAEILEVNTSTIWRWQIEHEEFCNALRAGKEMADQRVERCLYQRAVGYSFNSQKIMQDKGKPVIVPYVEHVPPDVGAQKLWLTNRKSNDWAEKSEVKHDASEAFAKLWKAVGSGATLGKEGAGHETR